MSDAQRPEWQAHEPAADAVEDEPTAVETPPTDVDGNPLPSPELLAEQALPAVYSRSPRLVRVVATAAFGGAVIGAVIGAVLPSGFTSGRVAAAAVMAFAGALIGALLAGAFVVSDDSREARHVAKRKASAIDEWLAAHPDAPPEQHLPSPAAPSPASSPDDRSATS